jgi:hypothetical protein
MSLSYIRYLDRILFVKSLWLCVNYAASFEPLYSRDSVGGKNIEK